ncbi:predicted protein, partial [Scheffersomyces stipitis CBS 6054]
FPRMSERKSRRTHKNSRDGCPNCKAKRIKCSEELPSCHNCIKKNYRCGYLDFPKEKLDHIRKKNDKKSKEQDENTKEESSSNLQTDPTTFAFHKQNHGLSSDNNSTSSNGTSNSNANNATNPPHDIFADLSPLNQDSFENNEFCLTRDDLRVALYRDSFHKLTSYDVSSAGAFVNEHPHYGHHDEINSNGQSKTSDNDDNSSSNSFENSQLNLSRHIKTANENVEIEELEDLTPLDHHSIFHPYPPPSHPASPPGTPLANAISQILTVNKLKKTKRLRNGYLKRYLKQPDRSFKSLSNTEFRLPHLPVWRSDYVDQFWISVFNQSIIIKVYYSFFMDKSINILLKVCNKAINTGNSSTSFTKKDLDILTKKSYTYYGLLIRDLRESITEIHIEYPIKISLYAAWSTFLHLHTNMETLCLMFTGTASLFGKIVNDAKSVNDITHTLQISIQAFNDNTNTCLVPDYKFDVIKDLYQDLLHFKSFIVNNQSLTSPNNVHILRNFLELESFMKNLIECVYPRIMYINSYYKLVNNVDDDSDNIIFTSPSLFFEMLADWFDIFPSEAVSIGSKMKPLRKTFYLFYVAIGRALLNVFSPIRSMLLIDTVHVIHPKVDFNCNLYRIGIDEVESKDQFFFLRNLSHKLMRTVIFFNNRTELLCYYLSTKTVLNRTDSQSYLMSIDAKHNLSEVHYQDIVKFLPQKLEIDEIMLSSLGPETTINYYNYPLLKSLLLGIDDNPINRTKVLRELIEKQENLHGSFNYRSGIFESDFDISEPIDYYRQSQQPNWSISNWSIEETRLRISNFDCSRRQIAKSV